MCSVDKAFGIKWDASPPPLVLALTAFHALVANLYLSMEQPLLLLATVMADGKGGFNELLFSFGD